MSSIQSRLILALTTTSAVLLLATGAVLDQSIGADLVREYDAQLFTECRALSSLVILDEDAAIDFEFNPASMPQYQQANDADYFVIRTQDGRPFASSASMPKSATLGLPMGVSSDDILLPGGVFGRAAQITFIPQPELGVKLLPSIDKAAKVPMTIIVARSRTILEHSLLQLRRTLAVSFILVTTVIVLAVASIVRASLHPLRAIGERVGEIDASNLNLRLQENDLPDELAPIQSRLNDLLDRLDKAFARERRFTSDIAHELRTPIAELRMVAEVALRWPNDSAASLDALRESHAIARQMQTLVNTLLALARTDSATSVAIECVPLRDVVEKSLIEFATTNVTLDVPPEATVRAEPILMLSVLRNVLGNAFEYGLADRPVGIQATRRDKRWVLTIENLAQGLAKQDIEHVFEPFWRKDSARGNTNHAGLGLALVRGYCGLMRVGVRAFLRDNSIFCIEMDFEAGADEISAESAPSPRAGAVIV